LFDADPSRIRKIQAIHKVKPALSRDVSQIGTVEILRFAQNDKLPESHCR